jgi:hypothetical protein
LARCLFPVHVLPRRFRRKPHLRQGCSSSPTRVICSSLIAKAFSKIGLPVLPRPTLSDQPESQPPHMAPRSSTNLREPMEVLRHSSLITPGDFDLSPYFEIVKLTGMNLQLRE